MAFDTSVRFKINDNNAGKAIAQAGKAMMDLSDTQLDKKKREEAQAYKNAMMDIYENQDKRAEKRLINEEAATTRLIEKAKKDETTRVQLEDATIKAFEQRHPIFMGLKKKDGSMNEEYKSLTRADKLALIKLGSNEVINPKSPKVKDVSTREDGERIAIFSDGSVKSLGFKVKDYQQSNSDDASFDLSQEKFAKKYMQNSKNKNDSRTIKKLSNLNSKEKKRAKGLERFDIDALIKEEFAD